MPACSQPEGTSVKIRAARKADLGELVDVTALSFERGSGSDGLRSYFERFQTHYPKARPELSRIVEEGGRILSAIRISDKILRVGAADLRAAGMGDVATHPDHRKRGYMTALFRDSLAFMDADGFDISILYGIDDFYHRFGYATTMSGPTFTIQLEQALFAEGKLKLRKMRRGDLPAATRIHDRESHRLPCCAVRDDEEWRWALGRPRDGWMVAGDARGRAHAYLLGSREGGRFNIAEMGVSGTASHHGILSACADRAKRQFCDSIRFPLPPDHDFTQTIMWFGGDVGMGYSRNGGGMGRIINLDRTIDKMLPEWTARLGRSPMKNWRGTITLKTEIGSAVLSIRAGLVRRSKRAGGHVIGIPQNALLQAILGFRSIEAILTKRSIAVDSDLMPVLDALFPQRCPSTWGVDGF